MTRSCSIDLLRNVWYIVHDNNRILFKSCRVFLPFGKGPTQTGGDRDPATNVQFVKLNEFRLK
jgi:hypothetical protein